jgi:hypothetical protein
VDWIDNVASMALRSVCIGMLLLTACTRRVDVSAVRPSKDFTGLSQNEREDVAHWSAFEALVPVEVARSIRRWQLTNVTLHIFRCGNPKDAYPANARLNGKPLDYDDLHEPLPPSTRLTFYVPLDPKHEPVDACAALDARGYSPVFLRGQTVHLSPLRATFPHFDEKTGRVTSS